MSKQKPRKNNLTELDARRIQKQLKQQEQNWKQVDDIYQSIAQGIVDVAAHLNDAIRLINLVGTNNANELVATVNGMRRDLESFTNDLVKIKSRHENYSGVIQDENELALCLSVFNDYVILHDRFKAIIFTPMLTITEFLTEAQQKAVDTLNLTEGASSD